MIPSLKVCTKWSRRNGHLLLRLRFTLWIRAVSIGFADISFSFATAFFLLTLFLSSVWFLLIYKYVFLYPSLFLLSVWWSDLLLILRSSFLLLVHKIFSFPLYSTDASSRSFFFFFFFFFFLRLLFLLILLQLQRLLCIFSASMARRKKEGEGEGEEAMAHLNIYLLTYIRIYRGIWGNRENCTKGYFRK